MEFIRISDSKLKIMLDGKDMAYYDIDEARLSGESEETRRAVRRLLDDARRESGFDAAADRILVEMYPSRVGGCELYITKVREGEGILPPRECFSCGDSAEKKEASDKKEASTRRGDGESYTALYEFGNMEAMLAVCRQLHAVGFRGKSAAYAGSRFFLAIAERRREGRSYIEKRISYAAEEYGRRRECRMLLGIKENAICLADGDAVLRLAPYYVGRGSDGFDGENDIR